MKLYLGDSVYVRYEAFGSITLTTENGVEVTNTVILEPEVFDKLTTFVKQANELEEMSKQLGRVEG